MVIRLGPRSLLNFALFELLIYGFREAYTFRQRWPATALNVCGCLPISQLCKALVNLLTLSKQYGHGFCLEFGGFF